MFWLIAIGFTILFFIWQERTNTRAAFLPKLIVAVGAAVLSTIALYVVFALLKVLFWPLVIVFAIVGIYLAFFSKKRR